jgi:hypothetical protein
MPVLEQRLTGYAPTSSKQTKSLLVPQTYILMATKRENFQSIVGLC